jgi:sperm-associated antigen 16 protein
MQETIKNLEEKIIKNKGEGTIPETDEEDEKNNKSGAKKGDTGQKTTKPQTKKFTPIPAVDKSNPYLTSSFDAFPTKNVSMTKSFKGHLMPISSIAVHPRKSFIATASDDRTWKIWGVPNGELIMSGEGHSDWVSGLSFDPQGTHLATCSGDSTVKVWDFVKVKCAATFKDHIHPVWDIDFHHSG